MFPNSHDSAQNEGAESLQLAREWCGNRGSGWRLNESSLGKGGTAPVYEVFSPDGPLALKLFDREYSDGNKGQETEKRITEQLKIGEHGCPYLVNVYDGGRFGTRLFLLMSRASGAELEKNLSTVPRNSIRKIVDQVARAMIFLEEHGLCHRDVKSANVFV